MLRLMNVHRSMAALAACCLALATACGSEDATLAVPSTSSATSSPSISAAPSPTAPAVTPGAIPATPPEDRGSGAPESPEAGVRCLHDAAVKGDRTAASMYATEAARDEYFALAASDGGPAAWILGDCGPGGDAGVQSSAGMFCRLTIPGKPHGLHVIVGMSSDHRAEDVGSLG